MKKFLLSLAAVAMGLCAYAQDDVVYLIGSCNSWPSTANPAVAVDGVYTWNNIVMPEEPYSYFAFTEASAEQIEASDWDAINELRYAPAEKDTEVVLGEASTVDYGVDASWKIAPGTYNLVLNVDEMTLVVTESASLDSVVVDSNVEAVYYNLQGVRVANPEKGVFVKVAGKKATKVML